MKRIGIVCYPTFGGSGVVATELGIHLAQKGYEIHFISYKKPVRLNLLQSNIFFHKVEILEYPLLEHAPFELALTTKIYEIVKRCNLDIIHTHYAIPHAFCAYSAQRLLAKEGIYPQHICTLHGTDITLVGHHPAYKKAVEFSINHADVVTCVSESLKRDTHTFFDIDNKIEVIPNFIKVSDYNLDQVDRSLTKCCDQECNVTHISNFREVKRVHDMVEVFYGIQKQKPARLYLAGEGPEMAGLKAKVKEMGIQDKVEYLGNMSDVKELLLLSDIFLLPSLTESFGLAALEAMVAYTPVISTNSGGLPEVNIDGVSGYTHDIGDVEGMINSALRILSDDEMIMTFKNQAHQQAMRFDIANVLPLYEKLYHQNVFQTN